jgi:hypothetical protein
LGGPVYLPKIYNGHNRTFFFLDYEGSRRPNNVLEQLTVPTAAMQAGNLNGVPGGSAVDPTTGQPFPNNQIPASRLNPAATKLLSTYYPLPNTPGAGIFNNYNTLVPVQYQSNGFDGRIDHYLNQKQRIFARFSWKSIPQQSANTMLPYTNITEFDRSFIVSHNFTITPTLLNEFQFGFSRYNFNQRFPVTGQSVIEALGITGLDLTLHPNAGAFPCFDFSDGTGFTQIAGGSALGGSIGNFSGCGSSRVGNLASGSGSFNDNLTWVKGRHTLKFGVEMTHPYWMEPDQYGGGDEFGLFTYLSNTYTGNAYGDFLLGLPFSNQVSNTSVKGNDETTTRWAFYAQDGFRVTSRLTINFGLRYSINPAFADVYGNISQFLPATDTVVVPNNAAQSSGIAAGFIYGANICLPNTNVGYNISLPCSPLITASQAGLPSNLQHLYWKSFAPRFSVAWRPFGDKTVFRAGFGIFTLTTQGTLSWLRAAVASVDSRVYYNTNPPSFVLPQAYAGTGLSPSQAGTENFLVASNVNLQDPQSAQWNVSIDRDLSKGFVARISYIGMNSYRMILTGDYNQVRPSTTPYTDAEKPYLNWGPKVQAMFNLGFANYQAAEVQIRHRLSSGFSVEGTYTFAKNLTNAGNASAVGFAGDYGSSLVNLYDAGYARGNSAGTRRDRFLFTGIYELPFGRGRHFLNNSNKVVNGVFGGWQLSTITMIECGPYVTPTISATLDQSNTNATGRGIHASPDAIGNPNVSNSATGSIWNIAAFARVPVDAGRFGDAGQGTLEGPGEISVAGGLSKTFAIAERARLRFEGTFTNLLNHPNFAVPATSISTPASFGMLATVQTSENGGNRVGQLSLRLDF